MEKEIIAKLNRLRIAPRKVRLLADLIRGKKVDKARSLLDFTVKRGSLPLRKLLDSAVSNAKNNFNFDEKDLIIKRIFVDEGTKLKRWRARSRGRANRIEKKTSHITIILDSLGKAGKKQDLGTVKTENKKKDSVKKISEPKTKQKREDIRKDTKTKSGANKAKVFMRKSI